MLVLSEMQKDGALRGKRARHRSAHPELEGGASTQNVKAYADPCVPGASVLYVQATRSSLLRSVRTWGTGPPLRHGSYTVRVPVPHVPRTTAYRVPRTAYRVPHTAYHHRSRPGCSETARAAASRARWTVARLCRKHGLRGWPARTTRLLGRGWPKLGVL